MPLQAFAIEKSNAEVQRQTPILQKDGLELSTSIAKLVTIADETKIQAFNLAPSEFTEITTFPTAEQWEDATDMPEEESPMAETRRSRFTLENGKKFTLETTSRASTLLKEAISYIGVPYRFGGDSVEEGFDCSGFVKHVFQSTMGFTLPRVSKDQAKDPNLQIVSKSELKPGDLVFFNTHRGSNSHVGMYVGEKKFIHAPRSGREITIESLTGRYWNTRFTSGRRLKNGPLATQYQGSRFR